MTKKIKRFAKIDNFGIFKNFDWDTSLRDKGNNVINLKDTVIIYGRNYSGKTTLSRIMQAFETGSLSDKFDAPSFSLLLEDNSTLTQNDLANHSQKVRVFNKDFIAANLGFIFDGETPIKSFAILGDGNPELLAEMRKLEGELGLPNSDTGLRYQAEELANTAATQNIELNTKEASLKKELTTKAAQDIKRNMNLGIPTYDIRAITKDIETLENDKITPLSDDEVQILLQTLKEEAKPTIDEQEKPAVRFENLKRHTLDILRTKISATTPIQELLDDAALQVWVKHGREFHEGKRETCAFCTNKLPTDLWERLDGHFNAQSEELDARIKSLIKKIETEIEDSGAFFPLRTEAFYNAQNSEIEKIRTQKAEALSKYQNALADLRRALQIRQNDIFKSIEPDLTEWTDTDFSMLLTALNKQIQEATSKTTRLTEDEKEARDKLRLNEVAMFLGEINYSDKQREISKLRGTFESTDTQLTALRKTITTKEERISEINLEFHDEQKGAERVNEYLANFFGHEFLRLEAFKERDAEHDTNTNIFKFKVMRDGTPAYNLSEGECSLLAFCYFMARLGDAETGEHKPIIWIDDPISSLDSNHVFFVYSLINSEIVGKGKSAQLFISTHNLDFLKYLKRLPGAENKNRTEYLIVTRHQNSSEIIPMPRYLRDFVTEFNYLFDQIYKCAHADPTTDPESNYLYSFGNNLRKFLEIYMYFKYPDAVEKDEHANRLKKFLGDDPQADALISRVTNEGSHLAGTFERAMTPVDIPETQKSAQFLLTKIQENDSDQYNSLLKSIGEGPVTNAT